MKNDKGIFIAVEGIDGSGKSYQVASLYEAFVQELRVDPDNIVLTQEPGKGLRKALAAAGGDVDPATETLLFLADRNEHIKRVIRPSLEQGKIVICDRYHASTLAYQSWGKRQGFDVPQTLFRSYGMPVPDLTLLIDVPATVAMERIQKRGKTDQFEKDIRFLEMVREGYKNIAWNPNMFGFDMAVINGVGDPDVVTNRVIQSLCKYLGGKLYFSGLFDTFSPNLMEKVLFDPGNTMTAAEERTSALRMLKEGRFVSDNPMRRRVNENKNPRQPEEEDEYVGLGPDLSL